MQQYLTQGFCINDGRRGQVGGALHRSFKLMAQFYLLYIRDLSVALNKCSPPPTPIKPGTDCPILWSAPFYRVPPYSLVHFSTESLCYVPLIVPRTTTDICTQHGTTRKKCQQTGTATGLTVTEWRATPYMAAPLTHPHTSMHARTHTHKHTHAA